MPSRLPQPRNGIYWLKTGPWPRCQNRERIPGSTVPIITESPIDQSEQPARFSIKAFRFRDRGFHRGFIRNVDRDEMAADVTGNRVPQVGIEVDGMGMSAGVPQALATPFFQQEQAPGPDYSAG
jgi:hypothetical protein